MKFLHNKEQSIDDDQYHENIIRDYDVYLSRFHKNLDFQSQIQINT